MAYKHLPIGLGSSAHRKVLVIYAEHEEQYLGFPIDFIAHPRHGDNITIGSVTYTFVTALSSPSVPNEIKIGGYLDYDATGRALNSALRGTNLGVKVSYGTVANPDVCVATPTWTLYRTYSSGTNIIFSKTVGAGVFIDTSDIDDVITPNTSSREWLNHGSADFSYTNDYIYLSGDYGDWASRGYEYPLDASQGLQHNQPPLSVAAKMIMGDDHPIDVVHVGLNEESGVITPYIVPSSVPYGYYAKQTSTVGMPANANGWAVWDGAGDTGSARRHQLIKDIVGSGYLNEHVPAGIQVDNNISGIIDLVLVLAPVAYAPGVYPAEDRNYAGGVYFDVPIVVNSRTIYGALLDSGGIYETGTTLHEYFHGMYYSGYEIPSSPEFRLKFLSGIDDIYYTLGEVPYAEQWQPEMATGVNDVYIDVAYPPADLPWGNDPCLYCNHFCFDRYRVLETSAREYYAGVLHPLMAMQMGYTSLNRIVKESGVYEIKNMLQNYDVICIQSPHDPKQFLFLNVYYPLVLDEDDDYPYSAPYSKGVYGTVFNIPTGGAYGWYSQNLLYSNISGTVRTYMVDTCTEYWGYGNIGVQESRYKYWDSEQNTPLPNAKLVLIDYAGAPGYGGLSRSNPPFGVEVEFIEWKTVDGVPTASVNITIDPITNIPDSVPLIVPDIIGDTTAKIIWNPALDEIYEIEYDTDPAFETSSKAWVTGLGSIELAGLTSFTTYYARMRATLGVGKRYTEWSETIEFTTIGEFWRLEESDGASLVGTIQLEGTPESLTVTAEWESETIVYDVVLSSGLTQIVAVPVLYPGERVTLTYSYHYDGVDYAMSGVCDTSPDITVVPVSSSGRHRLTKNNVLAVSGEAPGWTTYLYLCTKEGYSRGIFAALQDESGHGVIYNNMTEVEEFKPLSSLYGTRRFTLPNGNSFGCYIEYAKWCGDSVPTAECSVCYGLI